MTGPRKGRRVLRRLWRREEGSSTLEFIVLFPFLGYLIFGLAETGVLIVRSTNLDRGVDIAVRDVRLGQPSVASYDGLRDRICQLSFLLGSCNETLRLELTAIGTTPSGGTPSGAVSCTNRADPDISPPIQFDTSTPGEIVIVRACLIVDPVFPGTGFMALLPKSDGGGYALVSRSAFMNEPRG